MNNDHLYWLNNLRCVLHFYKHSDVHNVHNTCAQFNNLKCVLHVYKHNDVHNVHNTCMLVLILRSGLYYLRSMDRLPDNLLQKFLNGKHVMRHNPGIWNAIWSDMFIESTFMRYCHESGGLTGLTLNPSAVTQWALSLHICSQIRGDLHPSHMPPTIQGY